MTPQEWVLVEDMLAGWWSAHDWTGERADSYRTVLGPLSLVEVERALRALGRRPGQEGKFRPGALEIEAVVLRDGRPETSTPEQAWSLVTTAIRRYGRPGRTSSTEAMVRDERERHQAAIYWIADHDLVVAAWAAQRGLFGPGSLGQEPVHARGDKQSGEPNGGAVLASLHREYRGQLEQADDRERLGRPRVHPDQLIARRTTHLGQSGRAFAELLDDVRPAEQLRAVPDADPTGAPR